MYRTCIYCQRDLGSNQVIERFPVGGRLAFDSAQGRLWVICERCRRWNLSPMHERWEAIEECERHFHDTPLRFSTDNIGLARLPEGLELVRVGKPVREEFAAWRYGRRFIQRRIRSMIKVGAQVAGYAAAMYAGFFIIFFIGDDQNRVVARVRDDEGNRLRVTRKDLKRIELNRADTRQGWSLRVSYRPWERIGLLGARGKGKRQTVDIMGANAMSAAGLILPKINSFGGSSNQIKSAVKRIEEAGSPERLFALTSPELPRWDKAYRIKHMDADVRLALEMAAHENTERMALEGELAVLEEAWREAEEIAAISDKLLIPKSVEDFISRHKARILGEG